MLSLLSGDVAAIVKNDPAYMEAICADCSCQPFSSSWIMQIRLILEATSRTPAFLLHMNVYN